MTRKYEHLNLPKFLYTNDTPYREEVETIKAGIRGTPAEIAMRYGDLRREMDIVKEQKTKLQAQLDAYSEKLVTAFEEQAMTSLKLASGASVRIDVKPYPVMRDREAFRQWCIKKGLVKEMHLHSKTTESLVANLLLVGDPLPEGVEAFMKDTVVFTKAKK